MALAALTAGACGQEARAAKAGAKASVITIKPLSILQLEDLDFGTFAATASGGTVVIEPVDGGRSTTGGVVANGGSPRAAQFLTYATAGSVLLVTRGPLSVLTREGGGATMAVTALTLNGPTARVVNPAGVLDLRVGGTLAVGPNQLDGIYTGSFTVTVTYF